MILNLIKLLFYNNELLKLIIKIMNLRKLKKLKQEIIFKYNFLIPFLIKLLKKNSLLIFKYNFKIVFLIIKKQKYLSLLSKKYGFLSYQIKNQIYNWLLKLDLKIYIIILTYNYLRKRKLFKKKKLFKIFLLKYLKYFNKNNLNYLKRKKIINYNKLKFIIILNNFLQILFIQILEPIIDVYSDFLNFGYHKIKNSHQAIIKLKNVFEKKYKNNNIKYILKIKIKKIFNFKNSIWILKNYPIPNKFKFLLYLWLNYVINFKNIIEIHKYNFLFGFIIYPSLLNFSLNGLNKIKNIKYIRYLNDFIIIINSYKKLLIVIKIINNFLLVRGLNKKFKNIKIFKISKYLKFEFLGFIFKFINNAIFLIYPSINSIIFLKNKLKFLINKSFNFNIFKFIELINYSICLWINYFSISLNKLIILKIDYFIWYLILKYLKNKFNNLLIKDIIFLFFKFLKIKKHKILCFFGINFFFSKNLTNYLILLIKSIKLNNSFLKLSNFLLFSSGFIFNNIFIKWIIYMKKL